ncbi:MAG: PASTA domain-containing protein [Clostridiales bacterium]|nr:PASTA domain-containing protein [Clostridiales bacterium]
MNKKEKIIEKTDLAIKGRLLFLMVLFLLAVTGLGARLAYLQLVEGGELSAKAASAQNKSVDISPRRGAILDRNGEELAINTAVETVTIDPVGLRRSIAKTSGQSVGLVAENLAGLLGLDADAVQKKIEKESRYEALKKKAERETGEAVRAYAKAAGLGGIDLVEDSKRYYKNNNLAAHVIGMTGDDNQGLSGIEYMMEKYIKGTPGMIKGELDASRAEVPLSDEERVAVQDGQNVVLTIDTTIQFYATQALEKAIADNDVQNGGAAIIMDPRNGDILALVSKPDFNLNDPYASPPGYISETWNGRSQEGADILNRTVWRNKAIMDTYEPGSTFKAITTAAGLDEGVITLESQFRCEPVTGYGPDPIRCWTRVGHGVQDLTHAVYNSCNPAFMRIAQKVSLDRFYQYARNFGFYDKTGILLPGEVKGIFHTTPKEIDMLVASFGQRFTITPIQLITAYAAIANGGNLLKPRLVKELTDANGSVLTRFDTEVVRKVISKDTSDKLRAILEGVVEEGTGRNAYVGGFRVAGKTGTSQTTDADRYIASFCAFAPADNPVVCVLIMLDNPLGDSHMGGAVAAPVAQKLLEDVLTYMEVERLYNERDLKEQMQQVLIPNLKGKTVEEAVKALQDLGFEYKLQSGIADVSRVVAVQMPLADTRVSAKSVVALYADADAERMMVKVPDFNNKTTFEAAETAKRAGLNVRATGSGVAKGQGSEAGAEVEAGSVVDVVFRYTDNIE